MQCWDILLSFSFTGEKPGEISLIHNETWRDSENISPSLQLFELNVADLGPRRIVKCQEKQGQRRAQIA